MQRTGRKGHASFRVVVQDSRQTPTSGKFVAHIGSYDPHTKIAALSKEKAEFYLSHGAQPSDRVANLFKSEGVKLPKWVTPATKKDKSIKNSDKLRKNRPADVPAPVKEDLVKEDLVKEEAIAVEDSKDSEVSEDVAEQEEAKAEVEAEVAKDEQATDVEAETVEKDAEIEQKPEEKPPADKKEA